jgi:hypothetical protein
VNTDPDPDHASNGEIGKIFIENYVLFKSITAIFLLSPL